MIHLFLISIVKKLIKYFYVEFMTTIFIDTKKLYLLILLNTK